MIILILCGKSLVCGIAIFTESAGMDSMFTYWHIKEWQGKWILSPGYFKQGYILCTLTNTKKGNKKKVSGTGDI